MTDPGTSPTPSERRNAEGKPLGENAMRCDSCGTVWYSAVAPLTVTWATCAGCGGPLHIERRRSHSELEDRASRFV